MSRASRRAMMAAASSGGGGGVTCDASLTGDNPELDILGGAFAWTPFENISSNVASTDANEGRGVRLPEFVASEFSGPREIEFSITASAGSFFMLVEEDGGNEFGYFQTDGIDGDLLTLKVVPGDDIYFAVNGSFQSAGVYSLGNTFYPLFINSGVISGDPAGPMEVQAFASAEGQTHTTTNDWCGNAI